MKLEYKYKHNVYVKGEEEPRHHMGVRRTHYETYYTSKRNYGRSRATFTIRGFLDNTDNIAEQLVTLILN